MVEVNGKFTSSKMKTYICGALLWCSFSPSLVVSNKMETQVTMSWVTWCYCLLIVKLSLCSVSATDTSCPTWHYYNNATGQCECECGYRLLCSRDGNHVDIIIHSCATSSGQEDDYLSQVVLPLVHSKTVSVLSVGH